MGAWTIAYDAPHACGNSVLGMSTCLGYQANARGGSLYMQLIGYDRPVGDRIVRSIPLG